MLFYYVCIVAQQDSDLERRWPLTYYVEAANFLEHSQTNIYIEYMQLRCCWVRYICHMLYCLCTLANTFLFIFLGHWAVVDSSVSLEAVWCCLLTVLGGTWMCGESWLAVKDASAHYPSSQGYASLWGNMDVHFVCVGYLSSLLTCM